MAKTKFRDENLVLSEINALVASGNYIDAIAEIIHRDFSGSARDVATADAFEIVSYNELAFLIGIWIKNLLNPKAENDPKILVAQTDTLLKEYHNSMYYNNVEITGNTKSLYETFNNGTAFKEAFFYSSTAGYDSQYTRLLEEKYMHDRNWLLENKKIFLEDLSGFYQNIIFILNKKLRQLRSLIKNPSPKEKLSVFILNEVELLNLQTSYSFILDAFSLDVRKNLNSQYIDIADFNEFIERPIIKLDDNKYFIPSPYHLAEAFYEVPFYWMNKDLKYTSTAAKNRGKVAEDLVFKEISNLFGVDNVFRNIIINTNKKNIKTDIDVVAYFEKTAIIFQVKSKKLTVLSKKGNLESIKNDFKKAVEDAHDQANKSIEALENPNSHIFKSLESSNFLPLQVDRYIPIIVLLDQYPAITHQTHILFGESEQIPPLVFNIFDLETLIEHLKNPKQFVDYVHFRTQYSKKYRAANEIQYLGYCLEHGMEDNPNADLIYIPPEFGHRIDAIIHDKRAKEISVKIPQVGRNESCPCGSGKKFKKCHGC